MDRKWLPLNALRAFEAAGQHLSFTAAANSLTVAQSAVSRHVIVLENFLGVALFERRPQQLVLTEAGRHILPASRIRQQNGGIDGEYRPAMSGGAPARSSSSPERLCLGGALILPPRFYDAFFRR